MNLRGARRQRKKSGVGLDIINLIDVMLVLLIFFMATTTFMTVNDSIQLKLPHSTIVNQAPTQQIVVSIDANKMIYINGQNVSQEGFVAELSKVLNKDGNSDIVLIKGDKSLSYGYLVKIMSLAKDAGATQLDIATTTGES
ncbi:MAG: biopolymer transporter ExbD [Fusobacteria bacterium]|nr:biopolymer transporter ExbD [Fusobacteriota bacterium]